MNERRSRLCDLDDAIASVEDGMTVGISGFSHQSPPMAVVRALVRKGVRDLRLVSGPTAGLETDVLIGAGCVREVVTAGVVLERVAGIAPAFRRAAEAGEVRVWECDECIWYVALQAAAWGVPWLLWPGGVGTSLPELNADLREVEADGHMVLRVPAIRPDIVFLHAAESDVYGNVRSSQRAYLGRSFAERALVEACGGRVVATVERLIDNTEVLAAPQRTMVFGADIVLAPWGAHPGGVSGVYVPDLDAMREYVGAARAVGKADAAREIGTAGKADAAREIGKAGKADAAREIGTADKADAARGIGAADKAGAALWRASGCEAADHAAYVEAVGGAAALNALSHTAAEPAP